MVYKIGKRDLVFIFDVDGVIADTPQEESWEKTMSGFGLHYDGIFKEFYQKNLAGSPREAGIKKVLKYFLPEKEGDGELIQNFSNKKQEIYETLIRDGQFKVYEDVRGIILEAKNHNVSLAVCSSSENSKKLLENLFIKETNCCMYDLFDSVTAGAKSNGASKKSILYNLAYGRLLDKQTLREPAIVVWEDADVGVEAAREAGFNCIGVAREGLATPERLKSYGANIAYNEQQLKDLNFTNVIGQLEKILI